MTTRRRTNTYYPCFCGCTRQFLASHPFDGYHGPEMNPDRLAMRAKQEREEEEIHRETHHQTALRDVQLGGATQGWHLSDKVLVETVVRTLLTCREHGGVHHFAVTGEGTTVWMSATGVACINTVLGLELPVVQVTVVAAGDQNPSSWYVGDVEGPVLAQERAEGAEPEVCPRCSHVASMPPGHFDNCPTN
jgi:hypothetical protein